MITCVHSNDPRIKADILDWDEFNEGAVVSQDEADRMYQEYKADMPFDLLAPQRKIVEEIQPVLMDGL